MKEKWNTKSVYVVGKTTAALGNLLLHTKTLVLPCLSFLQTLAILNINAHSSRVWQAPGVTEVCEVMLLP